MSSTPEAGTYRLDGMLQGPFAPGLEPDFQAWADSAKAAGLHFHLRVEGGTFSLVPDVSVRKSSRLKGDLADTMSSGLDALLEFLPAQQRSGCFSTLRSEEFRPGTAVRTLYTIGPDGRVSPQQRTADIETMEAAPEITPASLRRAAFPSLVAILLLLFVSTFFIDYRKLFSSARDQIVPLKKEELAVTQETGGDIVSIELKEVDNKHDILVFAMSRGSGWDAAMAASPADATAMDWPEYSTLFAMRQARFRIELYNKKGQLLATREIDVRGLFKKKSIQVAVAGPAPGERIARVVLRP